MPKVSPVQKERRRQAILQAAEDVFLGKGYQLATVDDIAGRSGLSVGALYRYFPTKSDIMLSLLEERLGRTPDLLRRLTDQAGPAWDRLSRCIDIFAAALKVRHPSTGRLLLVAWGEALQDRSVREGLRRRQAGLVAYLGEVIQAGQRAGEFTPTADAQSLASLLVSLADGVTLYWSTNTSEANLPLLKHTMLGMLDGFLRCGPSREEEP